jgi:hypothetical protein
LFPQVSERERGYTGIDREEFDPPSKDAYVHGIAEINVTGEDANLDRTELYINNRFMATWDVSGTYDYLWNTTALPDGTYAISLNVYDKANNFDTDEISIIVDNTAPVAEIVSMPFKRLNMRHAMPNYNEYIPYPSDYVVFLMRSKDIQTVNKLADKNYANEEENGFQRGLLIHVSIDSWIVIFYLTFDSYKDHHACRFLRL